MSPLDRAASAATVLLAVAALAGLVVRRKLHVCLLFPVYLLSAALGHAALLAFPVALWNWQFWAATDVVQAALRLGVAIEIAIKTFRPLPAAGRMLRLYFLVAIVAIAARVLLFPREFADAFELALVVGWISYGVAFLFTGLLLIVLYYAVPLDPLHRAIAIGVAVASAVLAFAHTIPAQDHWGRAWLSATAYPLVLAAWTISAWRRDTWRGLSPASVDRLWPWRKAG